MDNLINRIDLLVKEYSERRILGEFAIAEDKLESVISHVKSFKYSGDFYFTIRKCEICESHESKALHFSICDVADLDLVRRIEGLDYYLDLDGVLYEPR